MTAPADTATSRGDEGARPAPAGSGTGAQPSARPTSSPAMAWTCSKCGEPGKPDEFTRLDSRYGTGTCEGPCTGVRQLVTMTDDQARELRDLVLRRKQRNDLRLGRLADHQFSGRFSKCLTLDCRWKRDKHITAERLARLEDPTP